MADIEERFFDFDDEIENDGEEQREFELLPAGEYEFRVVKVNKDYYQKKPGSTSKLKDNTPMVKLELIANAPDGRCNYIRTTIFLTSSFEWKISSFFRSIGLKKHGEKLRMDWDGSVGLTGKCRLKQRTYTSNQTGEEVAINDVDSFLDTIATAAPTKPALVPGQL